MTLRVEKIDAPCGARVSGIDLRGDLAPDLVDELRAHWLTHKVLVFPDQALSNQDLERFTLCFGHFGEDPFFGHIPGHEHIAAIQRNADEQTGIFAEFFHSDWSFLAVPPAGTCLFGIPFRPTGGIRSLPIRWRPMSVSPALSATKPMTSWPFILRS